MSAATRPSSPFIVTLDQNDAAIVLQAELNLISANDAKALLEAELKLTNKILSFLPESADTEPRGRRSPSNYSGPFRLGAVMDLRLEFPITAIPAIRLRKFNKPKTLILNYGVRLRVREDLKSLRDDCYLEVVRLPRPTNLELVCNDTLLEMNLSLYWNRFEADPEDTIARAPAELQSLINLDPGGEFVTFETRRELVLLFRDIQRSVDLWQEGTDLFVIRIMHDGHTCLEKLCLEMETFSLWLYALDTSHLPDLKPSSLKPIKLAITNDVVLTPGYGSKNFVKYFDRMEPKQLVPPLDQCLVIKLKEENIALITPHYLVRNELLFVLKTWLNLQKYRREALRKMLRIVATEPEEADEVKPAKE